MVLAIIVLISILQIVCYILLEKRNQNSINKWNQLFDALSRFSISIWGCRWWIKLANPFSLFLNKIIF